MSTLGKKQGVGAVIWDYLTTVDHKKIAILYLFSGILYLAIGGLEALLMRVQLAVPNNDFLVGDKFNQVMTMHGTTMIFFAAMPLVFAFMNALIPLQIGARDVAFPFVNSLGFWLYFFGALFTNTSWFLGGAPDTGWTAYASMSMHSPGHGVDFYVLGVQISGFGSLMGAINILVTIINMRAPGMTYMRLPVFTWTSFVSCALILFAFPALTVGLFFMMLDRMFGGNFYDPALGGNTIIWEHLFWIFGHPEVYILILPAFGLYSEMIPVFTKKRIFGYSSMVFATVLIGFLGFMVWAHHMFTVGMGPVANAIFSIATMTIAVPTGMKVFNWLLTMWGGQMRMSVPMMYCVAFIPSFIMGGVTGVQLATAPMDMQFHDTYFVVAHFHYVIIGAIVLGLLGGIHFVWPKMFGRMLNDFLGKITFWCFFLGFHLTFFIQHFVGMMGMPRRVFTFLPGQGMETGNLISSWGSSIMAIGTLALVVNIILTFIKGPKASNDPWRTGRSLEWSIPSPPPEYNFAQLPLVRGLDPWWIEKMDGKKAMTPAEPLGDIHMPNGSILPLFMSLGLFIAAYGATYNQDYSWGVPVIVVGMGILLACMCIRSIKDDHGYYIPKEEVIAEERRRGNM